ncbi:SCO family protein [Sphingomonas spermidinifaciens]|uniref:SCO family protein n=1 Tax=Sphingomonas spermidinifaciens TaxID=1141889 RepID=A0A2A4BA55_9SPHN|nr:SCO family protein [Sphingomonas spermidinifaciens]PCD04832.1 SCO family protein [Sphingomonas spermidinifaciens]
MNDRRFRLLLAPLLLALAACGAAPKEAPPLEGARIGGPFTLTDENGRRFTDTQLAGKWRIMYFGYTFCPDVCPVDMANITAGLKAFEASDPARAAKVVPVFVTVDPARDTPAVLKQFVGNFHPRTVGLTGEAKTIESVQKAFAIYAARKEGSTPGAYLMDHSRQTYLIDGEGKPIALVPADEGSKPVADTLAKWVS